MRYAVLALIPLAACVATTPVATAPTAIPASLRATVHAGIAQAMKDPDSVRFRNEHGFKTSDGDTIVCGEVNAKNSFGGYVGFSPYYVRVRNGEIVRVHSDQFASAGCQQAASGVIGI